MEPEIELEGFDNSPTESSEPGQTAIDITSPTTVNLPQEVVEERAQKANLGLGEMSPGLTSLRESIARGDEQYARETSADELRLKERDNRLAMLTQLAQARVPGSPITQDEIDLTAGLTREPIVDPRTVWERQYGNYLTNRLVMNNDDPQGAINGALTENAAGTYADLDYARDLITKNERVNARLAEMQARWKESSWWDAGLAIAETIIPGKSSLNISGRSLTEILDMGEFVNVIALPGNNLREQIQSLLGIPDPDAFAAKLDEVVDRIADTNIIDAIDFLQAVQSFSPNEQFLKNAFGLADVADVGALAGAITKGLVKAGTKVGTKTLTKAEAERIKAVDDTLKATTGPQHPEKIAAQIGATEESAVMKVLQRHAVENDAQLPATFADRVRVITDMMPTFSKPGNIFRGESSLSNTQAVRLTSVLENNIARFIDTVTTTISPERLPPEALRAAVETAKEEIKKDYTRISDAVLDIVQNPRDPFSNTDSVSIRFGKPDANTFTSSEEATLFAKDIYELPEGTYTVGQQGTSFYIDVMKPIRETATEAQDLVVNTNNQSPIPNLMTMFIQGIRTPAEITSAFQKANRDAALLGNVNFTNMLSDVAAPIGRLTKNQRKDLGRVMDSNRDFINEAGERGRYYDTVQDLEQAYLDQNKRLPTEGEIEAYYSAVQINEMDLMLRNFTAYRDLSRQGISEFQVRVGSTQVSKFLDPDLQITGKFKGREVAAIPRSDPNLLPIAIVDEMGEGPKMVYKTSPGDEWEFLDNLVKNHNYSIIQVARPQERVLFDSLGVRDPVQYIVTKNQTKLPLDFQQVGRQPGFHVEYADPYFIKQPRVSVIPGGTRAYEGDATLWSVGTRAQGLKFEKRVNELREAMLRSQKAQAFEIEDFSDYIIGKLPENEAWWRRQFSEDGYFNIDQPFRLVAKGQSTRDIDNSLKQIRDLTDSQHTLTSDMDRKFQGERSQQLLSPVEGTEENPAIRLRSARMVDAMTSTSQGIGQATRSRYFGDMKISVADQFVNEFSDLMDVSLEELRKYPMYYLHNPPWRTDASVDQARLAAAQAIQKTTMEFAGRQTPFGKTFDWLQTKLLDSVYQATGEKGTNLVSTMSSLANERDPTSFFRKWAFRAKMGLFNVNQIFVQANGLAHITAIAPQHAVQSMGAYYFTRMLMFNDKPEIVAAAAQKMGKLGWKPEHFEESFTLLKRTGWQNVGREATFIDDMSDPKLYENPVSKWLDKSAIFFTETERMIRLVGWHAAYRSWRAANPNATVTNAALGQILSKADTMTMNMTNASKASWERGVLSIPAQFQSYNVRLFEQLWGGQLSWQEKARVMGVIGGLYGVPIMVSAPLAYPFYEDIRQYALENGYNVNNKFIEAMVEGLPAMMMSALGLGDLNFGQRFGPGGLSILKDLKDGDKTLLQAAMGPGGSVFTDIAFGALPAGTAMIAQMVSGKNYEPEAHDVLDALRTISSVNNSYRVYAAMQYGKYISRKGVTLSESDPYSAAVSAITGLQPREFTDKMIMNDSLKDLSKYQRDLQTEIQKYGSRALTEYTNGNKDAGDAYMKKASALIEIGDFTPSQKTSIAQNLVTGKNKTLVDRINRDWVMKGPASKRAERLKNMENSQ